VTSEGRSSCPPALRYARLHLPSSGSLGSRFPTFSAFLSFSHRYSVPLRLPFLRFESLRFTLASRYLVVARLSLCPRSGSLPGCKLDLDSAWPYFFTGVAVTGCLHKEMTVLSSSQATPLCTCPARRSRWCPFSSPLRLQDHSLPEPPTRRLSRAFARLSSWTTTLHFSGLSHAACTLATPGFIRTLTGTHAGSLEIRWLTSSHGNWAKSRTHWATVSNFTTSFPIPRI